MRRAWGTGAACLLLVLTLAGCTPAVGAVTGVRWDAQRGLIGVFVWCGWFEPPSRVDVYAVTGDPREDDSYRVVLTMVRTGPPPTDHYLELALSEENPGWTRHGSLTPQEAASQTLEVRMTNAKNYGLVKTFTFQLDEARAPADPDAPILFKGYEPDGHYHHRFFAADKLIGEAYCR
jgi:hypothetical protein